MCTINILSLHNSMHIYMKHVFLVVFLAANSTLPDHRLTWCSATSLHSANLSPRQRRSNNNYY